MPRVTEAYRNEDFDPKILSEMVSPAFVFPYLRGSTLLIILSKMLRESLVYWALLLMDMDVRVYRVFHTV